MGDVVLFDLGDGGRRGAKLEPGCILQATEKGILSDKISRPANSLGVLIAKRESQIRIMDTSEVKTSPPEPNTTVPFGRLFCSHENSSS